MFRNFTCHTDYFRGSFFPHCTNVWNKLAPGIRNSVSVSVFKKSLLGFIRPQKRSIFNINDPNGLRLLTRLRVNLSHLRDHKFKHNFLDTIIPLCSCSLEVESTDHYLLRCPFFTSICKTLLDSITTLANFSDDELVNLILYGNNIYSMEVNAYIIKCTITFLKDSEKFNIPLI